MRLSRMGFGFIGLSLMITSAFAAVDIDGQKILDVLEQSAFKSSKPQQSALLSVAFAGKRLVAVGARGRIILSDDNGTTWRQAESVPVRVSLTCVRFASPRKGWAVGHGGVVLRSEDAGETWSLQLNREKVAKLLSEAEKEKGATAPTNAFMEAIKLQVEAAKALMPKTTNADIPPDKPFLDLYVESEERAFVLGAYNLIFHTEDGGKTWKSWQSHVENPMEFHIYAMRRSGEEHYIVGEQGLVLRSSDGAKNFKALRTPYDGTYFGILPAKGGELVVFGLRGNVYWSGDRGATWRKVEVSTQQSITAGIEMEDGSLVLATNAGELLLSRDKGRTFQHASIPPTGSIADAVRDSGGGLIMVGLRGLTRVAEISVPANTGKQGAAQ